MAVDPGRVQFGAERGSIALLTTRDGLAATAGHDLTIEVSQWSAELEVADDLEPTGLTVRADMNSLVVREGRGGVKPLTDRDRREIAATARRLLRADQFPGATFTAAEFGRDGNGGGTVAGTLSLAGAERPLRLTVTRKHGSRAAGPAAVGSGAGGSAAGEADDSAGGAGPGGSYHATATLRQTDFGIKPYTAFFGALKVSDAVRLEIDVDVP
jgi:polyisoprenoid-binding protein YceI